MQITLPGYKYRCYVLVTTLPLFLQHSKEALGSMQRGDEAAPISFLDGSAWKGKKERE